MRVQRCKGFARGANICSTFYPAMRTFPSYLSGYQILFARNLLTSAAQKLAPVLCGLFIGYAPVVKLQQIVALSH